MRTVVEELLGLRAVLSANGEASIELAESLRPDVILMDLMMPVLDGFEAITRLRSNPATASIPIIAVTALGRPTDRQRALDIGATDYLSKPFDLDTLTETIGRYVGTADAAKSET
jgi:CheY-like chemotaxis protein